MFFKLPPKKGPNDRKAGLEAKRLAEKRLGLLQTGFGKRQNRVVALGQVDEREGVEYRSVPDMARCFSNCPLKGRARTY
jgi:hypothetical protein